MIDQKQVENVEHFNYLCIVITNDTRCTRDIKSGIVTAKEEDSFHQQIGLEFKKDLSNATYGGGPGMVLKVGHFGKYTRNTWKVLKCGAREGRRRLFGPIV